MDIGCLAGNCTFGVPQPPQPSGWLESFLLCFAPKVCLWNQHLPVTDSRHHEPPVSGFSEQRWAFDRLSFLCGQIQAQQVIIGNRLGWFSAAQGVLFSLYLSDQRRGSMPPIWAPLLGIGSAVAMALTLGAIVLRIHQLHFRLQILDRECRSNSIVLDLLFPIRTDDGLLRHLRWTDWVPLLLPVACVLLWGLLMLLPVAEAVPLQPPWSCRTR